MENDFLISNSIANKKVFIKEYLNKNIQNGFTKKIGPFKETNSIELKDINKDNIKRINIKENILKKRDAGIDLLRIIGMIGIVYTHVLFETKGLYKYHRYKNKLLNLYTYIFWHVNAYGLISGFVGCYKSIKYSNLLYIWLSIVFYSMGIHYYFLKFKQSANIKDELYIEYYPIIYNRYWYCTSYFGMFIFLPAINKGILYINKPEFKLLGMSILGIFVFWQNYMNNKDGFLMLNKGYSSVWLLCLYIIGAYIRKFNVIYRGIKRYIFSFIYFLIFLILCSIFNKYRNYTISDSIGNYKIKLINFIKRLMTKQLNSIIRTSEAIFITLFFLQLKYNEYLSKVIFFFSPLTFGVYLIHFHKIMRINYLSNLLNGESNNLTFTEVIKILIIKSLKYFLECIFIEYLRHLLFSILKIRKFCISMENLVFNIVS